MKTHFIVKGYIAFSEQDNYENGCYGPTKNEFVGTKDWSCKADSLVELLASLSEEFKATNLDDFQLDSCEENGRLDLQVYQKEPFNCAKPSQATNEAWKAGKLDLWLTNYIFQVEQVVTDFSLTEQLAREKENA